MQVSRSRKAFALEGKPRKDLSVACDQYRAVIRNAKANTKVKLVNLLTGQTLLSHTVVK